MEQQYQPPPPQQYQPQYTHPKPGIQDFFVAKDKLGLFLLLGVGVVFIGILVWSLVWTGLVEDGLDAINFLGILLVDLGILVIIALLLLAGIYRDDLPEKTRNAMIIVAGVVFGISILVSFLSGAISSGISGIDWSSYYP